MKIVRLNKTHKLFHEGYTHAVRYTNWSDGASSCEKAMSSLYGDSANYGNRRSGWKYYWGRTAYWIGVKDDSMLTMMLLAMG